jgi:uncharacterized membrane protein
MPSLANLSTALTSTAAESKGKSWIGLSALLGVAGVAHFRRPDFFDPLIPRQLGSPRPWVYGSGVAELACAAAVALPATRRAGGLASAALFVGVFPGNVTMAQRAMKSTRTSSAYKAALIARLPLQIPLVALGLRVAKSAKPSAG